MVPFTWMILQLPSFSSSFSPSEWVNRVPMILIFGVATTVDSLRNILPSHVLHHLCPCKFMLGSPADRMDSIIEAVLVKHCAIFSIGYKVALFLRNNFLNKDGTLTSFIRALKVGHTFWGNWFLGGFLYFCNVLLTTFSIIGDMTFSFSFHAI